MISAQIIFGAVVECFLILVSALFLLQPKFIFREISSRAHSGLLWLGMFSLCLTFCWSVIFGSILFLNHVVIRF